MSRLLITLALCTAACGGYRPGTLSAPAHGELRTVGCLDVSIAPFTDAVATGPVASIVFANRCDAAVRVDLAAVRATGVFVDGQRIEMRMFDPDQVVRPGKLEARMIGQENIEWMVPEQASGSPTELCLDLAGLDADADLDRPVITCIQTAVPGLVASR